MEQLLERLKLRLGQNAFANEAAVSHGLLIPLLQALGWDPAEPDYVIPEFASGRGRVDFALCGTARRPAVFVEVKAVGRSLEGDRQLFEYAFHEGVPLCVLTDGREWNFYLPSGQGSYDERRVYKLQLDERETQESSRVLHRYLQFDRVKSGAALEAAASDYRDMAAKREAARILPKAWADLIAGPEELLIDLLADQAESICGFRPSQEEVLTFLRRLPSVGNEAIRQAVTPASSSIAPMFNVQPHSSATLGRAVHYNVLGASRSAKNGNGALVDILSMLAKRDPSLVPELASSVRTRSRNHIARTAAEVYPSRPDLARAEEFAPGWLVGLNIANREKVRIIQRACDVYGLRFGSDVIISLPNE